MGPMKLALRNRLAEWLLAAMASPTAEGALRALIEFARTSDESGLAAGLGKGDTSSMLETDERIFERAESGLRLRADLLGDLEALRWRAKRFERALSACRRSCGPSPIPERPSGSRFAGGSPDEAEVAWSLCAAAALFDAELFFEVHEILEPAWGRAADPLKQFLQGLIQVAVGLHHQATGNLRGAVALLTEGTAKLRPFVPEAWGVELGAFTAEVDALAVRLRTAPGREEREPAAAGAAFPRLVVRATR